jgi:hypothetical protein
VSDIKSRPEGQTHLIPSKKQEGDLSNHNLIENKKTKVNKALKMLREMKSKPRYKDKLGNNVK